MKGPSQLDGVLLGLQNVDVNRGQLLILKVDRIYHVLSSV